MKLKDKVAIITGGGSGMGRATSLLFSKEGAKIGILDLDVKSSTETLNDIESMGGKALFVETDVSDESKVITAVKKISSKFGTTSILVNAAGMHAKPTTVSDFDLDEWDRVFSVNVKGTVSVSKHVLKQMIKNNGGTIINIASIGAFEGGVRYSCYCATKAAVLNLTKSMALEYGDKKIRVNCICPGNTVTPLLKRVYAESLPEREKKRNIDDVISENEKSYPIGRWGRPEDIAQTALFLASNDSCFITGASLLVDGGYMAGRYPHYVKER